MFFSIYHHYRPYGQIDVVRIIVFRACPFSKFECPTHVISAKGFVSEVRISALSLLRSISSGKAYFSPLAGKEFGYHKRSFDCVGLFFRRQ